MCTRSIGGMLRWRCQDGSLILRVAPRIGRGACHSTCHFVCKRRITNADVIAAIKRARDIAIKSLIIDERAIGAAQVGDSIALAYETYFGVMGRGFRIVDYKLVVRGAPKSYYSRGKGGTACRALKHCFH